MKTSFHTYKDQGLPCNGYLAYDFPETEKRPAVLVIPAWRGQDAFARDKTEKLASLGYVGFTLDLYGEGKTAASNKEAPELMAPLFFDRALLRRRVLSGFEAAKDLPMVDSTRIGAIGFCFGGLVAYELFRSGANVRSVVTFHAIFANELERKKASLVPLSSDAKGSLLVLHGYEDPLVSSEDLERMQKEMTEAQLDWQVYTFGHTMHAFTNPAANDPDHGTVYQERSAKRAWHAMVDFFQETLQN